MSGRSQVLIAAACVGAILALNVARFALSVDYRIGFLYLPPLVAAAWWLDRRLALAFAAAASVALVGADIARAPELPIEATVWNEFTRVTTLLATTAFVAALRQSRIRLETERQAMFELTLTDPLTGVYNRRFLEEQMGMVHAAALRDGGPYSVLAIDVDGMKGVNDAQGAAAGDAALAGLAALIRASVRQSDVVVRMYGDEFVVLIPGQAASDSANSALRLIYVVAASAGESGPRVPGVSIGVAGWNGREAPEQVVARANELQFEAKRRGGSRFVLEEAAGKAPAFDFGRVRPTIDPRSQGH